VTPEQEGKIATSLGSLVRELEALRRDQVKANAMLNANIDLLRGEHKRSHQAIELLHEDVKDVRARLDRHGRRLAHLEEMADTRPDPSEITGVNNVDLALMKAEQLRMQDAEKRRTDSGIWWKRQTVMWFVGAAGALAMALIGGLATVLFWALTRKP